MNDGTVRILVALLLAVVLFARGRAMGERPLQQRAYTLAGAAMLAAAGYNMAALAGAGIIALVAATLGGALFLAALVTLVLSLRAGERRDAPAQVQSMTDEFREKRG
jgi:heme A synthase